MIKENRVSKYLLYAIGEIVLVVIGILIALQVNNWNQERHRQDSESIYLTQLLEGVKADSIFYRSRLDLFQNQDKMYTHLIQLCEGTLNDSILASIPIRNLEEPFIMAALGSATLKSIAQGGQKISDPTIKQSVRHYEQRYEFVTGMIGLLNDDIKLYGRNLLISRSHLSEDSLTLADYKVLCDEENFNGILALFKRDLREAQGIVQSFLVANESLNKDILEYLESKP